MLKTMLTSFISSLARGLLVLSDISSVVSRLQIKLKGCIWHMDEVMSLVFSTSQPNSAFNAKLGLNVLQYEGMLG